MRLIFFLISFTHLVSFAQQTLPVWHDSTQIQREVQWLSSGQLHSSHIGSGMSRIFLFGGFIDDAMKAQSFKTLSNNGLNRTGAVISSDLVYTDYSVNLFGMKEFGLVVLAGYQNYFAASYRSDLYRLLANGNADFSGEIELADTRFFQMAHQKIGFGMVDKKTRSTFAISLVNSSGYQNFDLINGVFRQSPDKDTTDILLVGDYQSNNLGSFSNGLGAAIDVDLRIPVTVGKYNALIQIVAQNIGFVRYNKASNQYSIDSLYRYTGFSLNQVQGLGNETFSLADSLNFNPQKGGQTQYLPGFLQVAKIVDVSSLNRFQSFFGINMYTQIIYLPQAFAGIHYKVNRFFSTGLHGSYGGFGGARIGFYSDFTLGQFKIGLSSQDVLGTLSNSGFGHSLLMRLTWQQK